MEEEEVSPVYVRKSRKPYSGMVLDSIFGLLIKSIGAIVAVGLLLMFIPLLLCVILFSCLRPFSCIQHLSLPTSTPLGTTRLTYGRPLLHFPSWAS